MSSSKKAKAAAKASTQKTTAQRLQELVDNRAEIAAELIDAGIECPPSDGLAHLSQDLKKVVIPRSQKKTLKVSQSGPVMRGEFVKRCIEYSSVGTEMRWAQGGVKILATKQVSDDLVGVVFTQAGDTKFKLIGMQDNALAFGNTLTLVEAEEVETAVIVDMGSTTVVLFNSDASGQAAVLQFTGRTSTLKYVGEWEPNDVDNICACYIAANKILAVGMRSTGEAYSCIVTLGDTALAVGGYLRLDIGNDTDAYVNGWSLVHLGNSTAVLHFPVALNKPIGFAVIDVDSAGGMSVRMIGNGKYASSLPCVSCVSLGDGKFAVAYGICWLSADNAVTKSALAVEVWSLARYGCELLFYGLDDARYLTTIGGIHAEDNGCGMTVAYITDNKLYATHVTVTNGPDAGPGIEYIANCIYGSMVPISLTNAILITQRASDTDATEINGYAKYMEADVRVVPSELSAYGIALKGGQPGVEIDVSVVKPTTDVVTPTANTAGS